MPDFDVIVVGAGPAGCILATLLARANLRVALFEQSKFPREKVCGECLSALGISVLRRHHLDAALLPHHPVSLTHCVLQPAIGESVSIRLPEPMWGLSRGRMDSELLAQAESADVAKYQPCRVEEIIAGETPSVRVRDLSTNAVTVLTARVVLLADGKGALARRRLPTTGELGVKCHFVDIEGPENAIELFGLDGHYVGLAPIEDGRWNLAMAVPATKLKVHQGNTHSLLTQMRGENRELDRRLHRAKRVTDFLACPLPRFKVADDWEENVIPLGNAAAAVDPIGGEGMGLAIASAELAAIEVSDAFSTGRVVDVIQLQAAYRRLWRTRSWGCKMAARALSSRTFASVGARLLCDVPAIGRSVVSLLGK